jgi:hypothetical protein
MASAVAAGLGVLLSATSAARAGNYESFFLGTEAALQGGATTATARLGTAIWYNPAGLARVDRSAIDASVTAFSLSLGQNVDLASTLPGSEATRLKAVAFDVVPAALTYARQLSFGGGGFGLFVPEQNTQLLRTRLRAPGATGEGARELSVDIYSRQQSYHGGPAFGFSLGPRLDLGGALFVVYRNSLDNSSLAGALDTAGTPILLTVHTAQDEQTFGIQPVAGVQVHPGAGWELGFVVRLPTLRVFRQSQAIEMSLLATPAIADAPPAFVDDFGEDSGFAGGVMAPLQMHLGVASEIAGGQLSLDGSYRAPYSNAALGIDERAVFNLRVGGRIPTSENVTLGAGLFSDRAADRLADNPDGRRIHYYGASFGIQLDTKYGVISRAGVTLPREEPLIFRTTLAVSYLLGVGELERIQLREDDAGMVDIEAVQQHVVDHQIVLHLGATVLN